MEFVVHYQRYLHALILELLSDGTAVDFKQALGAVNEATVQRITAQKYRNIDERLREFDQRAKVVPRSGSGDAPASAKNATSDRKTPVCLSHDPARPKECRDASSGKCQLVHLDTGKADEAKRFEAACKAFNQRRTREGRKQPY